MGRQIVGPEDGITKTEERSPPVHSPDAEYSQELETMTIRNRNMMMITFSSQKEALENGRSLE